MDKQPSFFIVGAPKCGTTSLCNYLNQHPSIFIPRIKEPNFFGKDLSGVKPFKNIFQYLNLFEGYENYVCGEGSTWYLFSKYAAEEIWNFNSGAKIIVMLREPVELLYSLHHQMIFDGNNEDIKNFEEALMAEDDRRNGYRIPQSCLRKEALMYSQVIRFSEQVNRYYERFGQKNVHCIIYDDFKTDTLKVYKEVLSFLGIEESFDPEIKIENGSKRVKSVFMQNALKRMRPARRLFHYLFTEELIKRASGHFKRSNTVYEERKPMDISLKIRLQAKVLPEVEALEELIGKDLSAWKNLMDKPL